MKYCWDELIYKEKQIVGRGWAAPDKLGDTLVCNLLAGDKTPMDVEINYAGRADVIKAVYGEDGTYKYGFSFVYPISKIENCILQVASLEHPEDKLEIEVDVKHAYIKYCVNHSPIGKIKFFLELENKKDYFRLQKYSSLEGEAQKYAIWYDEQQPDKKELKRQSKERFAYAPMISLIVPVYKPELYQLDALVQSVLNQSYSNWQLCLANGSGMEKELERALKRYANQDTRIKTARLKENRGISGNTNVALKMADGEWIALADQDDLLSPEALYQLVAAMNEHPNAEVLYSDEDKVDDETGFHCEPHFKPDYNRTLLTSNNYICHLFAVKRSIANEIGGFRKEFDGSQDYDFVLRCIEHSNGEVIHIPKMLYSWRIHRNSTAADPSTKLYAFEAGRDAVADYYRRNNISAEVKMSSPLGWYETRFILKNTPLVSILIPNKDHGEDLTRCINSILEKATYQNYEIIIIENNSEKEETFQIYETLKAKDARIQVVTWDSGFNYAAINNFGAGFAKGEYLLLLNNDTELISPDLFESMLGYCMQEKTAVVGAKLYYPDNTVQHAGVVVGVEGVAYHLFLGSVGNDPGYMGRLISSQNMSAVTGACMMVKKTVFDAVGGMSEEFVVAYNDVDLCLKIQKAGYDVVYDAFAKMYHYESQTRGYEESEEQKARLESEAQLLRSHWPERMGRDPYYNEHLGIKNGYYKLR